MDLDNRQIHSFGAVDEQDDEIGNEEKDGSAQKCRRTPDTMLDISHDGGHG
jgi:hypothetical protein